jgi:hypothetical protein
MEPYPCDHGRPQAADLWTWSIALLVQGPDLPLLRRQPLQKLHLDIPGLTTYRLVTTYAAMFIRVRKHRRKEGQVSYTFDLVKSVRRPGQLPKHQYVDGLGSITNYTTWTKAKQFGATVPEWDESEVIRFLSKAHRNLKRHGMRLDALFLRGCPVPSLQTAQRFLERERESDEHWNRPGNPWRELFPTPANSGPKAEELLNLLTAYHQNHPVVTKKDGDPMGNYTPP